MGAVVDIKQMEKRKIEIQPCREILSCEQEKENVLFMTLSKMNSPAMYKYENAGKFIGISQLEAGTKNVLFQLAKNGKKLSRIVIVESKDTRTKEVDGIQEEFWDDPEFMKDKIHSAVCFYKQRILDYIRKNYSKKVLLKSEKEILEYDKFEDHFPQNIIYTEEELAHLFYDIPTDAIEDRAKGVYKDDSLELFMEIIYGIKGNDKKPIDLYVDTQGGLRSAIQQINAVLELLKEQNDQNVVIKGRYAIPNFDYKDQKRVYQVKEVSEAYRAYDLVSAMNEFRLYGRGKGLSKFFEQKKDHDTRQIINMIQKISGAIALCNIDEFVFALDQMREIKKKIDIGEMQLGSEIRIVFQEIVDDYASLLEAGRTEFDTVKWCVKKYYYQQAITIIESRMPKMLLECGYIHYNAKDIVKDDNGYFKNPITIKELAEEMKEDWKHTENYLFEQWIYTNEYIINKETREKEYFGGKLKLSGKLQKEWKAQISNFTRCKRLKCKKRIKDTNYFFKYEQFDQSVKGKTRESMMFRMFAALSKELKLARNGINHGNSNLTEVQIRDALNTYIEMGEELKLNEKWKRSVTLK